MKRRDFITLLGGSLAFWPTAARAQQRGKQPTIGYLGANSASAQSDWTAAFVQGLREVGWVEGQNVTMQYRWANGAGERYNEIAAEFVRLKVDVIVSAENEASAAAKQATSVIPIVFPVAGDPIGTGLVASLAHPGGNATGISIQQTDLVSKRPLSGVERTSSQSARRVGTAWVEKEPKNENDSTDLSVLWQSRPDRLSFRVPLVPENPCT